MIGQEPLPLGDEPPLRVRLCEAPGDFAAASAFVDRHHSYIQWADRPSRKLYWLVFEHGRLVGVFGLGSAYVLPKAVQDWMAARRLSFNEVANNIVYCLAGARDRNLGTRALALLRREAAVAWRACYGDTLRGLQTFIMPPRTGAVYLADNWRLAGRTTGDAQKSRVVSEAEAERLREEGVSVSRDTFAGGAVRLLVKTRERVPEKLILVREVKRPPNDAPAPASRRPPEAGDKPAPTASGGGGQMDLF